MRWPQNGIWPCPCIHIAVQLFREHGWNPAARGGRYRVTDDRSALAGSRMPSTPRARSIADGYTRRSQDFESTLIQRIIVCVTSNGCGLVSCSSQGGCGWRGRTPPLRAAPPCAAPTVGVGMAAPAFGAGRGGRGSMARVPEFRDERNLIDAQSMQALVFGTMKRTGVTHHGLEYVKAGEEYVRLDC